ncbi:EutN/CcmL family microcompartment protein [Fonticella tunisiensis]|uniref:Ethanolamine utilization protein EutN n=1 Tax=Fonticella tunisiensis TaxID=1096341 RepID=A0A4V3ESN4_9CLOT|nr:EutN/CcmL family microcompartment protein [Fonticella tunisiensis]TDT50365.1 ethanolamine utilization protein EutN [Fonticella tunisiensis]
MFLARVVGNVVSTQKDPKFVGTKLLIVQKINLKGEPMGDVIVAVDTVGAGVNETVLVITGSGARHVYEDRNIPADASIIGIVDTIEVDEKFLED